MQFIIKFVENNRRMIVCNADRSHLVFDSEAEAQAMADRLEEKYKQIHYVTAR